MLLNELADEAEMNGRSELAMGIRRQLKHEVNTTGHRTSCPGTLTLEVKEGDAPSVWLEKDVLLPSVFPVGSTVCLRESSADTQMRKLSVKSVSWDEGDERARFDLGCLDQCDEGAIDNLVSDSWSIRPSIAIADDSAATADNSARRPHRLTSLGDPAEQAYSGRNFDGTNQGAWRTWYEEHHIETLYAKVDELVEVINKMASND